MKISEKKMKAFEADILKVQDKHKLELIPELKYDNRGLMPIISVRHKKEESK